MNPILITGATGFLGRHLAFRLVKLGHQVTALGRNAEVGQQLQTAGAQFYPVDLLDAAKLVQCTQGVEYVFHCAALSSPWGNYQKFYQANVLGTKNVADACEIAHVKRLIHVSSPSIYFNGMSQLQISETADMPKKFANHYALTKYQAEKLVDQAHERGLSVVTMRPRALIGPYDQTIMPRVLRVLKRGWFPVFSEDDCWVDLTCVENVVDALILAMNAGSQVDGKKFNITNGEPVKISEMVRQLARYLGINPKMIRIPYGFADYVARILERFSFGREPILTRYSVGLLGRSQTLDISAARRDLHYVPKKSINQGLQDYANWWLGSQGVS